MSPATVLKSYVEDMKNFVTRHVYSKKKRFPGSIDNSSVLSYENVASISSNSTTAKRDIDLKLHFLFLRKTTKTAICSIDTSVSFEKKENSGKLITSASEKPTLGPKDKFDFVNSFEDRKCRFHFDAPQFAQVTEIDHREEVSYIVSEEFSE
jgi:hypothetical protein